MWDSCGISKAQTMGYFDLIVGQDKAYRLLGLWVEIGLITGTEQGLFGGWLELNLGLKYGETRDQI